MGHQTTNHERVAGELLSSELTAANFAEFHREVGAILRQHNQGEILAPVALWQIHQSHALVRKCNLNLEVQRQLFPPSSRKVGGQDQDHKAGEQLDGKM